MDHVLRSSRYPIDLGCLQPASSSRLSESAINGVAALFHESFGNWLEVIFIVPCQGLSLLVREILAMPEHSWKKGLSKEEVAKTIEFYQKRYQQ